jgi:hypothetical protein
MKKAYIIFGMKRSGHHAIVHWIGYNSEPAIHFNDYKVHGSDFIPAHKTKPVKFGNGKADVHIYNMEDFNVDNVGKVRKLTIWNDYDEVHMAVVLRDPFNWIASSMKCGGGMFKRINKRIELYKKQAKLFENVNPNVLAIKYNDWVTSEDYRGSVASLLCLDTYHKGVKVLSERGGGSSFDGKRFKKDAHQMDLFKRWEVYKKDPIYVNLIDMELCKISSNIFKFQAGLNK